VNNSKEADYIRIRSTVTSAIVGVKTKPVVIESLVAAPVSAFQTAEGTLSVAVKDRSGQPLANVPVTVNGPKLLTDMTNSTGCAVFAYIPTGTYTITLNQAGWLTSTNLAQGTVQDGKVTVVDVQYDRAATITGRFYTRLPGSTVDVAARGWYLSAAKKGSAPVSFAASPAPGPVSQITTGNLFPWAEGYGTYSGNCFDSSTTLSNDPTKSKTDYYDTYPGFVNAAPGQAHTVNVLQPSVKLFVRLNTSTTSTAVYTPVTNAHVVVRSTSTGCTDELPGFTTDANGYVAKAPTTTYDPSLPFGRYKICVDTLNASGRVRSGSVTVNNTDPLGTDAGTLTLPTTTGSVCS
jgi:hypothetical protein